MASLQELLAQEEVFSGKSKQVKSLKHKKVPIYICHDRKSHEFSTRKTKLSSKESSCRRNSSSQTIDSNGEPTIDEVSIRAVISILSGYIGRYLKDENFRNTIKEKFNQFLVRKRKEYGDDKHEVVASLELGIGSIDRLVIDQSMANVESLKNSIIQVTNDSCNIHVSAFARLFLSILYKLEKSDRISAIHLLQVFSNSPFLARTHLLSDLWDHLFLPHLLHLKVWHHKELEFVSSFNHDDQVKKKRIKALKKLYNEKLDQGTIQFALYYKQWLEVGAKAPAVPTLPIPSSSSHKLARRRSLDSCTPRNNLYRVVLGGRNERKSVDLDRHNRALINRLSVEEEDKMKADPDRSNIFNQVHNKLRLRRRSLQENSVSRVEIRPERLKHYPRELGRAIDAICSPDYNLVECEISVRVLAKAWLDSHGDDVFLASEFSKAPIVKGMLAVLLASNDNEVLELAISLLAELVTKDELVRQIVLKSDPQLEIFIRLLESNAIFLKAAVLLYLLKPKAKQMVFSAMWVPLVLRVVEFGDHLLTLFKVRCTADAAAFYLLDQLLNGFDDEDKNIDNAREVVSVGGLGLLIGRMEKGEINERSKAVSMIMCCLRADERCQIHLVENLSKESILELIVLENRNSNGSVFLLLTELLLSLNRRQHMMKFLKKLNEGWNGLNTMQILLVNLQKASPELRPLAAAILLQLDLLENPLRSSVYREEAVEAIIAALDCHKCDENVQQHCAKALTMLDGHFSYTPEKWLLEVAVVHETLDGDEEAKGMRIWLKRLAIVLLKSSNKCLLVGLSNCIANGIPSLRMASLFFVAWISSFICSAANHNFRSIAYPILEPQLQESSASGRTSDERLLASFALDKLTNSSGIE